eukprot:15431136-Alexandrium_andersonii.AAC.1
MQLRNSGVRRSSNSAKVPPARPLACLVGGFGICANTMRRTHPSGASGSDVEAVPGNTSAIWNSPDAQQQVPS